MALTIRFDALLVHPENLASRILDAATATKPNAYFPNRAGLEHRWSGWGVEGEGAVVFAVMRALSTAAGSVYEEMEAELVGISARGDGR